MSGKLRIVVADDDPLVRECLRKCLIAFGHEVRAVGGGLALLDACAAAPPDVVVSDVQMPDLDGITAVERLRRGAATPVVLLSGSWDEPALARAAGIVAVWCLDKPIRPPELARAVASAVGPH